MSISWFIVRFLVTKFCYGSRYGLADCRFWGLTKNLSVWQVWQSSLRLLPPLASSQQQKTPSATLKFLRRIHNTQLRSAAFSAINFMIEVNTLLIEGRQSCTPQEELG